jgi:hypothetical protein
MDEKEQDKIICELYQVIDPTYVSRPQLRRSVVILYNKVNELIEELFMVDPNNKEFNGIDCKTHMELIIKKINRAEEAKLSAKK